MAFTLKEFYHRPYSFFRFIVQKIKPEIAKYAQNWKIVLTQTNLYLSKQAKLLYITANLIKHTFDNLIRIWQKLCKISQFFYKKSQFLTKIAQNTQNWQKIDLSKKLKTKSVPELSFQANNFFLQFFMSSHHKKSHFHNY